MHIGRTIRSRRAFTLVELLLVIGILAILGTAAAVVLNPAELLQQTRDARRVADLSALNKALAMYQGDGNTFPAPANIIYLSLPDVQANCGSHLASLPVVPGWSYACKPQATYQNIDGSGWLPIDLRLVSSGAPLSNLPVDPVNTAAGGNYYTYVGGSWELTAGMTSNRYHLSHAVTDSGTSPSSFEIGPNLALTPLQVEEYKRDRTLAGYWAFDEVNGTTVNDLSGGGNNGSVLNGAIWTTGRMNGALSFDGTNDYVEIPSSAALNSGSSPLTITVWFKASSAGLLNGSILYNKENLYEASAGGNYATYAWQPHWAWDGGTSFAVNIDEWYHMAVVYDKEKQYVYENGSLIYQRSQTGDIGSNGSALRIGARGAPGGASSFFGGVIDEVRIYSRALQAEEILSLYSSAN